MSILDLGKERLILSVPEPGDRYYTSELGFASSDNYGYVGDRTTGSTAADCVLVGPDWKREFSSSSLVSSMRSTT